MPNTYSDSQLQEWEGYVPLEDCELKYEQSRKKSGQNQDKNWDKHRYKTKSLILSEKRETYKSYFMLNFKFMN